VAACYPRSVLRVLLLLLAIALTTACGDTASKGDCEKLLDHMVKLETRGTGGDNLPPEMASDLEAQQKELKESLRKDFMEQCTDRTPGSFVACALKKKNASDLSDCDRK